MTNAAMLELRKFTAPEIVFGVKARGLAGRFAKNLRVRKALVVTDPGVAANGWTAEVAESLAGAGVKTSVFDRVSPNPRDSEVMSGAEAYRDAGCDAIVAVGGGSPMDCAKGIGFVVANDRHILEFEGVDQVEKPTPPLICIPTTAGTGAEVSQFAIITDQARKVKIAIVSKTAIPDAALVDPEATVSMPPDLTANTGLDVLTHAIEAYVSNASSPVTDLFALQAVRLVAGNLPKAMDNPLDMDARGCMMLASMYAGLAFSNAILGAVHAMAHSLGGLLDLPHGQCNAILLDHVVAMNFDSAPMRYADIALALGADLAPAASPGETKAAILAALRGLKARVGVTATLKELGVSEDALAGLTRNALQDACMLTNPLAATEEDIRRAYQSALG